MAGGVHTRPSEILQIDLRMQNSTINISIIITFAKLISADCKGNRNSQKAEQIENSGQFLLKYHSFITKNLNSWREERTLEKAKRRNNWLFCFISESISVAKVMSPHLKSR